MQEKECADAQERDAGQSDKQEETEHYC